jgi:hypothetical protein
MIAKFSLIIALSLLLSGCLTAVKPGVAVEIKPFKSDGCSLFPDGWPSEPDLWYHCCAEHDLTYWQGGIEAERLASDLELKQCVLDATDSHFMADNIYNGVRFGGSPIFPNWYRWGYGWPWGRGYFELSQQELEQVAHQLEQYQARENATSPP